MGAEPRGLGAMSVHVSSLVWKLRGVPPMVKYVLIKLADHAKDNGADVRPSFNTVALECEVSYSTVQRAVEYARQQGWLVEVPTPGNRPNEYRFIVSALKKADRHEDQEEEAVDHTDHPVTQTTRSERPPGQTDRPVTQTGAPGHTDHLSRSDRPPSYRGRTVNEPSVNHQLASSPPTFADFWAEYPKRAGDRKRAESEKKFGLAVKRGVDPGLIVDGAKRYRAFCDATGKVGTEFVQQAPTWLNGMAWENEFTLPAEPAKAAGALPKSDEPERLGTRVKAGRLVYVWQGQDLSIDDAVKWHEDRNRALPPELERALEAA